MLLSGVIGTAAVFASVFGTKFLEDAWLDQSFGPLLTGFMLGAGLISVPWAMWTVAVSVDGSANWRLGADGEQQTARELHRLGASWRIEHNVPFPEYGYSKDVDHVAVGPYGALAVETKRTSRSIDLGAKHLDDEVKKAIKQAEDNAGRVRGLLAKVDDVEVIPLVVFWGPDVKPGPDVVRREGTVRIVAGCQAAMWRQRLAAEHLDPEVVERLAVRVREWRIDQEGKTIGLAVRRHLTSGRRLGQASVAAALALVVLLPAARAWEGLDRILGAVFGFGRGAVGGVAFVLPLVLALAGLGFVNIARRLDPSIPWVRGLAPLGLWLASFSALLIATP